MLHAPWGMAGYTCSATFVASLADNAAIRLINETVGATLSDEYFCVTQLGELLLCRYVGQHAERAKNLFAQVWELLRPLILARQACRPRIWHT